MSMYGLSIDHQGASLARGGGGGHLPQVWVSTVKLTPKAVAVTGSNRRAVILRLLYSEAVGHL